MDKRIEYKLNSLSKSTFRSSFHLSQKDKQYIKEKGIVEIQNHAIRFVVERLAKEEIKNDGKQTPMRGHPVFVAQHATGTCCRGCLSKIHKIEKDKQLNKEEIRYIVLTIMKWIIKEMNTESNL